MLLRSCVISRRTVRNGTRGSATGMLAACIVVACASLVLSGSARGEVRDVRFARNLGLGYLQLYVMEELRLVEKHAASDGLGAVKASYTPLGSPAAVNDALLSGSVDFGAAGVPPFIIAWDKTRKSSIQIKALSALNAQPAFLNTINPAIRTLGDFSETDRIALPAVKSSLQAILLQMAAEQLYGPGQQGRFDHLTVSLSHPDGTTALLSGRSEITAHFTSPPFQYQELHDPRVRRVLSSYDITGGPASFSALWTTTPFHQANPRTVLAVLAAVEEATAFIANNRAEATRIFIKLDNSKLAADFVESLLADPDITYSVVPQNFLKFSDFMARIGTIGAKPATWQDMFFPELHGRPGS